MNIPEKAKIFADKTKEVAISTANKTKEVAISTKEFVNDKSKDLIVNIFYNFYLLYLFIFRILV